MPKYSSKKVLTRDAAHAIFAKRARRTKVRVAGTASSALASRAAGPEVVSSRALFAGAFELAAAERDATERMQAAAVCTPVVDGDDALLVHVDGVVPLIEYGRVEDFVRDNATGEPFSSDLHFATYYAPLFWNCVHYCGGAAAVRAADCSVVKATRAHFCAPIDDDYDDAVVVN